MTSNPWILHARSIDGKGSGAVLSGDDITAQLRSDALAWVHLDANHPETRQWLREQVAYLDDLILDALLVEETRPRLLEHKDGVLLILRGVNLNESSDPEDMVSIRLWCDAHRIISMGKRKLKAVSDICDSLQEGVGPKNNGDFLVCLISRLSERMEPTLAALDDATDAIEEKIIESPDASERQPIIDIRKRAILLRRYISPQREAITQLEESGMQWLESEHLRHLREQQNRLLRYVEDLDAIRERAQIVKDELANALADRLNRNMYVLSVVAAIFLPLGFLTGLLGINVPGIPGAEYAQAFWVFSGMLLLIIVMQIIFFKWKRWF